MFEDYNLFLNWFIRSELLCGVLQELDSIEVDPYESSKKFYDDMEKHMTLLGQKSSTLATGISRGQMAQE